MRWLIAAIWFATGCKLIFPLELDPDARPDADPSNLPCSSIHMLGDDFSGPLETNWVKTLSTGEQAVDIVNDRVSFTSSDGGNAILESQYFYDLREDTFSIDVELVNQLPPSAAFFEMGFDTRVIPGEPVTKAVIGVRPDINGQLELYGERRVGTTIFSKFTTAFDPVRDRVWQFTRRGEDLVWATADATGNVSEHGSDPLPMFDFVRVEFILASATQQPLSVAIDNAAGGIAAGAACPISSLHDTFPTGTMLDRMWARTELTQCQLVIDNKLTFTPTSTPFICKLVAASNYDLREGAITLELSEIMSGQDFELIVSPVTSPARDFGFQVRADGQILAATFKPSATYNSVGYNAASDRWMRISAAGNKVFWDVSADGAVFTPFANTSDLDGVLDRVGISIQLTTSAGAGTPVTLVHVN